MFYRIILFLSMCPVLRSFFARSTYKFNLHISNSPLRMSTSPSVSIPRVDILVPIAEGTEEIEATTIIDTLVRGGAKVTVASVSPGLVVTCSRGVKLCADKLILECQSENWDMIVCPGGMPGSVNLKNSNVLEKLLAKQQNENKWIGAICAAPAVVLASQGLLNGYKATCYPASKFVDMIPNRSDEFVVVDRNIVTSQGPGTSLQFSLKLVEILFGEEKAKQISKEMLTNYY